MGAAATDTALVRICDLAGRERGTGFAADTLGTLLTSHEAVDGLSRVVVLAPGERTCLVEAAHITTFPGWDLALVHTEGLGLTPLVAGAERARAEGTAVRLWAGEWLDARITGSAPATYTSTESFHPLDHVLVLDLPQGAATRLRLSRRASGSPVLDAATGAVLGVLGTALHAPNGGGAAGFAVQPRVAATQQPAGPLARLLARNAATVPGFGPDLNLAGTLRLTAPSVGPAADGGRRPVVRPEVVEELRLFGSSGASVTALVGDPGTGRTTELAALAARRSRGVTPAPSVWLRGADLRADDDSVREAVARALTEAGRNVRSGGDATGSPHASDTEVNADVVARLARDAGRGLLVLLDAPEEMPPPLAHDLRQWTAGTSSWLRTAGARLAVACRPEFWEQTGGLFPADMLYVPGRDAAEPRGTAPGGVRARGAAVLPPCLRIGDLRPRQAANVQAHHGLPEGAAVPGDAGHPLMVRMLAEIRAAQQREDAEHSAAEEEPPPPGRAEVFAAYLDLLCLRVAVRLGRAALGRAVQRQAPAPSGAAVRRLAVRVAGQLHEAARRCLGPGEGALDRDAFGELFPRGGGWAQAVLAEGVLTAAGDGYRFADEELGEWLQGRHLGLDAALESLTARRAGAGAGAVPPPVAVPRHRIGPVIQALSQCADRAGPRALARHLHGLVQALPAPPGPAAPRAAVPPRPGVPPGPGVPAVPPVPSWAPRPPAPPGLAGGPGEGAVPDPERAWWAAHLLGETLLRLPDAAPYLHVLHALAEHIAANGGTADFGPWFWRRLPLRTADRIGLLRHLLLTDGPYDSADPDGRHLDAAGELLAAEPHTVRPLLCTWFDDERALADQPPGTEPALTVAGAALALLHTHRGRDTDTLVETLVCAGHPRADELLAELARDEPGAVCRAVDRWAQDTRRERRAAAAVYGLRAARHARTVTDRELLRLAALALLSRPGDRSLDTAALALLVRDPESRARHLDEALALFAETGAPALAGALGAALATHPEQVLVVFGERLHRRHHEGAGAGAGADSGASEDEVLRALAELHPPGTGPGAATDLGTGAGTDLAGTAARLAALLREYAERRPEAGEAVARFVRRRLAQDAAARSVLLPLADEVLQTRNPSARVPLARVLGAGSGPLRDELLAMLLGGERDTGVLDALLDALARTHGPDARPDEVRRTGLLLVRTPHGAALCASRLAELARDIPAFAARLRTWTVQDPAAWADVTGPRVRGPRDPSAERAGA